MKNSEDVVWMNYIRTIATLSVIILHVSSIPVISEISLKDDQISINSNWHIGNSFNSLVRFCVPAFVMLSGALLIPNVKTYSIFLKKRLSRIIMPFLFWSTIYTMFNLVLKINHHEQVNLTSVIELYVGDLLKGASVHLWYIYMIIGLYLIIPIIAPWIIKASTGELTFFIIIWFITIITNQFNLNKYIPNIELRYFSGYLGYLVLGYYLAYRIPNWSFSTIVLSFIFFIGYFTTSWGTYLLTSTSGKFSHEFYEYLSINVAMMACSIFLLFKFKQPKFPNKYFLYITSLSNKYGLGIYLVHVLVLHALHYIGVDYKLIYPALGIIITTILCFTISLLIIILINKTHLGKYVSG